MSGQTLLSQLCEAAIGAARDVAWRFVCMQDQDAALPERLMEPEGGNPPESPAIPPALERSSPQQDRLRRLADKEFEAAIGRGATPDVLRVVTQFLAGSNEPHTLSVARFAVSLTLQGLLGIRYTSAALQDLRVAYSGLQATAERNKNRTITLNLVTPASQLLFTLACAEGWIDQVTEPIQRRPHWQAYLDAPFGIPIDVAPGRVATALRVVDQLPEFGEIANHVFAQPTAIAGVDLITGGILPPPSPVREGLSGEGVISLLCGEPGTGKTTLALLYAQRTAELGGDVVFVATEENVEILRTKAITQAPSLREEVGLNPVGDAHPSRVRWVDGGLYDSLADLEHRCTSELAAAAATASERPRDESHDLLMGLPVGRLIVIDSLTALLPYVDDGRSGARSPSATLRGELHVVLSAFRSAGVSVLLVGGADIAGDGGLGYLVDNVFECSSEKDTSARPPIRYLAVSKTRYQMSSRGRHVLHLGGRRGCAVSPSLHAVLRRLAWRPTVLPSLTRRVVFPVSAMESSGAVQLELDPDTVLDDEAREPLILRDKSQVLLYGQGPTGKSMLALQTCFESRIQVADARDLDAQTLERRIARRERRQTPADHAMLTEARTLVVSFLYPPEYYARQFRHIMERRYFVESGRVETLRAEMLRVKTFQPGFIDPETLLQTIWSSIQQAQLEGRPFTSVVVDGIHNVLVQFPQLQDEPLLWSALFKLFRCAGVSVASTFTVFSAGGTTKEPSAGFEYYAGVRSGSSLWKDRGTSSAVAVWEQLLFHLLVSTADYSLSVTREDRGAVGGGAATVELESSIDRGRKRPLSWSRETLEFMAPAEPRTGGRRRPTDR